MEHYRNLGGNSNVHGFVIEEGSIVVQFGDGTEYLYTARSTGEENIERMCELARRGRGLNSFINRVVRERYARKIR